MESTQFSLGETDLEYNYDPTLGLVQRDRMDKVPFYVGKVTPIPLGSNLLLEF